MPATAELVIEALIAPAICSPIEVAEGQRLLLPVIRQSECAQQPRDIAVTRSVRRIRGMRVNQADQADGKQHEDRCHAKS